MLGLMVACAGGPSAPTVQILVDGKPLAVEVADDEGERARGLMFRDSMPEEHGMLFVYPDDVPRSFWMKDTRLPLSIAYLDATGTIVRILDMTPMSTDPVKSLNPARYALEVNKGWFERHDVQVGDKVQGVAELGRR